MSIDTDTQKPTGRFQECYPSALPLSSYEEATRFFRMADCVLFWEPAKLPSRGAPRQRSVETLENQ